MCGINNNKGNELYHGTALWVEVVVGGRGRGRTSVEGRCEIGRLIFSKTVQKVIRVV